MLGFREASPRPTWGMPEYGEELETHRTARYVFGFWGGGPSVRPLDIQGNNLLLLWGHDRL